MSTGKAAAFSISELPGPEMGESGAGEAGTVERRAPDG